MPTSPAVARPPKKALARSGGRTPAVPVRLSAQFWEPRVTRDGGGQSAVGRPELLPSGPVVTGAGSLASCFWLMAPGLTGGRICYSPAQNDDPCVGRSTQPPARKLSTPCDVFRTRDLSRVHCA